ncbi:flagellar export chaperone FlgN [Microbacterium sp. ASV81]|uniref:Flagellar export chaperone FlgN n=1 Tax=Microbacterium capsulatum TaxID=3041921 RepID=A0ABU0XE53_9MICO|nr:flagellar export chaperone FlgN [Microbacterium sp. ASV81]MDQ4213217.1 flagellar export chaperone FlgN [Microbacterium sp. ASV81]
MAADDLSMQLMRERDLLELLLFKLDEQQMLLATGRTRWVSRAADEVERVLAAMPAAALARDALVVAVAEAWGTPEAMTLRELIEAAPTEAWREIFSGHLRAMTDLADEIAEMKKVNEQRLRAALRVTQETIAGLGVPTGQYDPSGGVVRGGGSRLLDTRA